MQMLKNQRLHGMTEASFEAVGAGTDVENGKMMPMGVVEVVVVVVSDGLYVKTTPSDAVVVVAAVMFGEKVIWSLD
jgi:hypothetical protein